MTASFLEVSSLARKTPTLLRGTRGRIPVRLMQGGRINTTVKRTDAAIVDEIPADGIHGKLALCRCWLSKAWPKCDGSHVQHNKETGDNVGPVVVRAPKKAEPAP
eukprot:EG_transcript_38082